MKQILLKPRTLNILLLLLITAAGAALRFYRLGYQSFWTDETSSILDAQSKLYNRSHPPFSFIILRIFIETLGLNEFTARLPSCLFGIATIPLIYFFGKQLFSEKEGLIASFIISVFPWYVQWSQETRMYTEFTFFTILALYFFYQAANKETLTSYVLSVIFTTLAFYTHYFAIFIFGVIIFWLIAKSFFVNAKSNVDYKYLVIFFGLFFVFALPLFFITIPQTISFKTGGSGLKWGLPIHLFFLMLFIDDFGLTLTLFSVVGAIYLISQRNSAGYLLIAYAVIPFVAVSALTFITNIVTRHVVFTLPAYALLSARLIIEIFDRIMKGEKEKEFRLILLKNIELNKFLALGVLFAVTISVVNLPALYDYYTNPTHPDWKSACAYVESMMEPEDLIASTGDSAVNVYLGQVDFILAVDLFEPTVFDDIQSSEERVWLLIDKGRIQAIDPDYEFRTWLETDCELMQEPFRIKVYLYTPQNK